MLYKSCGAQFRNWSNFMEEGGLNIIRGCRMTVYMLLPAVIDEMQKSPIEKRKRNLKTISPHSRGEREIRIPLPSLERRKRNLEFSCSVSRGERET